ncbi:MAG: hypothetical protein ACE5D6_01355 [Candidatus Zixiibacteriota bacterium]
MESKGILFKIVGWVLKNGDVLDETLLRTKLLHLSIKEGINFPNIGPDTSCSEDYLSACRKIASELIRKECPY